MERTDPGQVIEQADLLLERRRTESARAMLESAVREHPEHPGLLLKLAWVDWLEGDADEALAKARQVLVQDPDEASARLLVFEGLKETGHRVESERVILDLLREYPEHAHYYGRYAQLMLEALQTDKAARLAAEGLEYDPDNLECLVVCAVCDIILRRAGANSHELRELLKRHPESNRTLWLLIAALQDRGDQRAARRLVQELVRAQPDDRHAVEAARELAYTTHWSLLPLWPMQRFGWGASIAIWLGMVLLLRLLRQTHPEWVTYVAISFLIYVVYSWLWPPLLRRILR